MTSNSTDVRPFDPDQAAAFAGEVLGILNGGALSLMVSIGHRTGLFDTMARIGPAPVSTIAQETGLNERYVREWLGATTTGGVVEYDPRRGTYELPPHRAACLTRDAGTDSLAPFFQMVPLLGSVEAGIVNCFKDGGGLSYEHFPDFHTVMADLSRAQFDADLVDHVIGLAPGLPERLTAGVDVLDVGCGDGHAVNVLAKAFPASRFLGIDIDREAIAMAEAEAREWGLSNADFAVEDATQLQRPRQYDVVTTFDAVHDQVDPERVLKNIRTALRPDGLYFCADINASSYLENNLEHPLAPFLYTLSTLHCMTVSLAGGGAGLGTMWGREVATEMLRNAGFESVEVREIENDPVNIAYIARP